MILDALRSTRLSNFLLWGDRACASPSDKLPIYHFIIYIYYTLHVHVSKIYIPPLTHAESYLCAWGNIVARDRKWCAMIASWKLLQVPYFGSKEPESISTRLYRLTIITLFSKDSSICLHAASIQTSYYIITPGTYSLHISYNFSSTRNRVPPFGVSTNRFLETI